MNADQHARRTPRQSRAVRTGRAVWFTFFTFPYAIVTVPFAVYLLGHLVLSSGGFCTVVRSGEAKEMLGCVPCIAAIAVFIVLTIGFTVVKFIEGWRDRPDNGSV